jgi:hypothetical protein
MGLRKKTDSKSQVDTIPTQASVSRSYANHPHDEPGDVELDAIERLKSNIMMLDDLQQRLQFMNDELDAILGRQSKKS